MDLSFSFERMRARAIPAAPDLIAVLASLAAEQALSPTAIAAAAISPAASAGSDRQTSLVALFNAQKDWACAGRALGGSFHLRVATAAAGKAGSTLMKPGFTLAF